MLRNCRLILARGVLCSLVLQATRVMVYGQATYHANTKMSSSVALILTSEFCATLTKKGTWGINQEKFPVGKAACAELEPALKKAFPTLRRLDAPPSTEDTQLMMTPKFVDVGATQALGAFSNRELVVLVEWMVKDASGKTVWLETVQGSSKHHMGNLFTHNKNVKRIVQDAVEDMAQQSASKMLAAPELQKVVNGNSDPQSGK